MWRILIVALLSAICAAQSNCPADFKYVGTLSGSGSYGQPFDEVTELRLPRNANFDRSYQQSSLQATNGQSGAKSSLSAKDIPGGLYIVAYGSNDAEKGWAVSEPHLKVVKRDDGSTDFLFGM